MSRTFAGIVRVSHMGERESGAADFHSERDQIAALEGAVPEGYRLAVLPSELDVSGGAPLDKRPSLRAAVEGVEGGKYAGIIVAYQSRLGRDVEHEEAVWRRVEAAGGRIILALDGIDSSTVDGAMVRRIRSAINHAERDRHAERFDNLRQWATEAGIWIPENRTPKGYTRDPETRKLVPNADAATVASVFEQRSQGATYASLAPLVTMTPGGVANLLRNRVYLGEVRQGPYVNPEAHPPLVEPEVFAACQKPQPRKPRSKTYETVALLAGVARCAGCGHVMSRSRGHAVVYSCHVMHGASRCEAPASVRLHKLDAYVEAIAGPWFDRLRVDAREGASADAERAELGAAKAELAAYLDAVSAADVGADAFAAGARSRRERVDAAQVALDLKLSALPNAFPADLAWADLPPEVRNDWLRTFLTCVLVERSGGRGVNRPLEDRVRLVRGPFPLPTNGRDGGGLAGRQANGGLIPLPDPDADNVVRPVAG